VCKLLVLSLICRACVSVPRHAGGWRLAGNLAACTTGVSLNSMVLSLPLLYFSSAPSDNNPCRHFRARVVETWGSGSRRPKARKKKNVCGETGMGGLVICSIALPFGLFQILCACVSSSSASIYASSSELDRRSLPGCRLCVVTHSLQ
jgi:hypothetical protein